MYLKNIYAKFQGNWLINEVGQVLYSLELFVKLLINGVSWSVAILAYIFYRQEYIHSNISLISLSIFAGLKCTENSF